MQGACLVRNTHPTMNFQSILRHWFITAATALTVWLVAFLTLSADDAHKLSEALGMLVEPLIVITGIVAVAAWRIFLAKAGSAFRLGSGETDKDSAGGLSPCVIALGMAAAFMGSLPSCSPAQLDAARAVPITFHLVGPDGSVGYSSKGGLVISGEIRATK
jgi:hypothetical protein